jgi:uncharacterized protein (TIGR00369 family)
MAKVATGFDIHVPFVEHLGLQLLEKRNGFVRMRLEPQPEFENSWGSMHGGALMTLLDVALATAGRSLDEHCVGALAVLAEGRAQRAGRSLIFSEGELRSEDGTLLAKATGTFKLLYPAK